MSDEADCTLLPRVESEAMSTYFLFRPRQIRVHPDLVATQSRERLRQC